MDAPIEHIRELEKRRARLEPVKDGMIWAGFWIGLGIASQSDGFWEFISALFNL